MVCDKGCDLIAFFEHGLVEADRAAPAIGTRLGADELVDVGVGDCSGGGAQGRKGKLTEELTLTTGEEHLGDPGGGKNADVPGTPVGNVGQLFKAEPGEAHLDGGEAEHILGVRYG